MKALKTMLCILMAAALCLSLAACMNNADNAQPQSTVQTDFMPETTAGPTGNSGVMGETQPPVAFDWVTGAGQIEGNVNRISEIADSRVVVTGTTALVGVKFTSAYQGEVTERIREMIAAEVMAADPNIQTVAVTASEEDVNQVYEISDQLRAGTPAESVAQKINEIVRNATTLR